MEKQNPFVPILNQLTKLMELIQEQSKISSKVPEEIKHDLQLLQEKYQQIEQLLMDKEILPKEEAALSLLNLNKSQSATLSAKDKRTMERVVKIKRDMRLFKMILESLRKKKAISKAQKNKESSSFKQRKKSFRSLSKDKDWIPL